MTYKANPCVDEEAQLQVGGLQRRQMLRGDFRIQVSWFDARILCQIVNHLEEQTTPGVSWICAGVLRDRDCECTVTLYSIYFVITTE